ncbi:MAG: thiamine-monophosphate kinase [Deltaproteobacteria bacterium]|nr:thiamine-monophosphate kinase [Deltaproteobacteria bacterium]
MRSTSSPCGKILAQKRDLYAGGVLEITEIQKWLGRVPRHPRQTHGINESDSEVLALGQGRYLASTIDSIVEEIAYELYQDPFTMGWMCATASLSDLAAVGAKPLGLLFSAHWQTDFTLAQKKRAVQGLKAALKAAHTPLLGGDTGQALATHLTGVGLGTCDTRPLSRLGLKPGDVICMTGKMGLGPALGFRRLLGDPSRVLREKDYRPRARVDEGLRLRKLSGVRCAMDSSDGLASTLNTLCRLNKVGLALQWDERWLEPRAARYCRAMKLPLPSLLFGEHGDFQLVVGVRAEKLASVRRQVPGLYVLGKVLPERSGTTIAGADFKTREIDFNLVAGARKDSLPAITRVFQRMLKYSAAIGK